MRKIAVVVILLTGSCFAQSPAKKAHEFHGKVEGVNQNEKSLVVNGEKVEGWMAAMTMSYKVDDPAVLTKVKPGDQIAATVYDGDYSLHHVRVVPPADKSK